MARSSLKAPTIPAPCRERYCAAPPTVRPARAGALKLFGGACCWKDLWGRELVGAVGKEDRTECHDCPGDRENLEQRGEAAMRVHHSHQRDRCRGDAERQQIANRVDARSPSGI